LCRRGGYILRFVFFSLSIEEMERGSGGEELCTVRHDVELLQFAEFINCA
jgi:hypothetical protein